jgi:UTP--glucose-1-phosphate uridylyltransferase
MDKKLEELCRESGVSPERLSEILSIINSASSESLQSESISFPGLDHPGIRKTSDHYSCPAKNADEALEKTGCLLDLKKISTPERGSYIFRRDQLRLIGLHLLPYLSYGVLNGGSATSYVDRKKNSSFHRELFSYLEKPFSIMTACSAGKTKSCTPAYLNADYSPGYSYIELKLRNILLLINEYSTRIGKFPESGLPVFQMTSQANNGEVLDYQKTLSQSPLLKDLIASTGYNPLPLLTATQPLLAALTHHTAGRERGIFLYRENGRDCLLPLPGGHGESFNTLKNIYNSMYESSIRFAMLSNSDNLGSTIDPGELAILALSDAHAGFEFSLKTAMDIKGGVLVQKGKKGFSCEDIGAGLPASRIRQAEDDGIPLLFNCATGLFNLEYLTANIDNIRNSLPIRISEQDKDTGRYAQAEQVTWEVIQLINNPLIFQVDKLDRFLASKLLIENLVTTGWADRFFDGNDAHSNLASIAGKLRKAFAAKMENDYKMEEVSGKWQPAEKTGIPRS